MSARDALKKYYQNQIKNNERQLRPKCRNQRPEKGVQAEVMQWLKASGFSCHSIEAKAVYSFEVGRYVRGQTDAGVADLFGSSPGGLAVFIELKAPGRRSTLNSSICKAWNQC